MAKRGSKANAVREYIQNHPTAKTREIVDALAKKRITVSESQVYMILEKAKGNGKSPAPGAAVDLPEEPLAPNSFTGGPLMFAKVLAVKAGGIEQARAVLECLADLQLAGELQLSE